MSVVATQERDPERGVALLLVVWVMALLAVICVAVTADVRSDLKVARNRVDAAQARALAEGGVWWGIERLANADSRKTLRVDGTPYAVSLDGRAIEVAIENEGGKLDINAASIETFERLFIGAGLPRDEARQTAQAIEGYRIAFRSRHPNDDPFAAIEEIRQVPGIGPRAYMRIARFLTVATGEARVNPLTAPREVLLTVPGMTPRMIEAYFARRNTAGAAIELPPGDLVNHLTWRAAEVVTVRATARVASGAAYIREAVVSVAERDRPYRIMAWRQGFAESDDE